MVERVDRADAGVEHRRGHGRHDARDDFRRHRPVGRRAARPGQRLVDHRGDAELRPGHHDPDRAARRRRRRSHQRHPHRLRPDGPLHRDASDDGGRPRSGREDIRQAHAARQGADHQQDRGVAAARHPAARHHLRDRCRARVDPVEPYDVRPPYGRRRRQLRSRAAGRHQRPPAHHAHLHAVRFVLRDRRDHGDRPVDGRVIRSRQPLRVERDRRRDHRRHRAHRRSRDDRRFGARRARVHADLQPVHRQEPADRVSADRPGRHHRRRRTHPAVQGGGAAPAVARRQSTDARRVTAGPTQRTGRRSRCGAARPRRPPRAEPEPTSATTETSGQRRTCRSTYPSTTSSTTRRSS